MKNYFKLTFEGLDDISIVKKINTNKPTKETKFLLSSMSIIK